MRITLNIDDQLAAILKQRALEAGKSFEVVVNETLRVGLEVCQALPKAKPYKIEPVSMGKPLPGINLDKALQLAGELEDIELARKMVG